jgi:hypothetical protein
MSKRTEKSELPISNDIIGELLKQDAKRIMSRVVASSSDPLPPKRTVQRRIYNPSCRIGPGRAKSNAQFLGRLLEQTASANRRSETPLLEKQGKTAAAK